jgi:hypothetical protein
MAESNYTAPNDFRAFCEILGETETSLCHHGIKGQQWGIRRFQDKNGRLTEEGRKRYSDQDSKKLLEKQEKKIQKQADAARRRLVGLIESQYKFNKEYTINDKLVKEAVKASNELTDKYTHGVREGEGKSRAILYPLSGGLMVMNEIPAAISNAKIKKTVSEIENNTKIEKSTGLKLKKTTMTEDEDMKRINPGYHNWSNNTKSNCALCTMAYALRRQGYDVTANGASEGYYLSQNLAAFPNAKLKRVEIKRIPISKEKRKEVLEKIGIPNGGYGNLLVKWANGGGHSMIYSVENGIPVIRDCQTNKVYKGISCNRIFNNARNDVSIIRLDNAKPDINYMKKHGMINPAGQAFKLPETKQTTQKSKNVTVKSIVKNQADLNQLQNQIDLQNHLDFMNQVHMQNQLQNQIDLQNHLDFMNQVHMQNQMNSFMGKGRPFSKGNKGKTSAEVNIKNAKQPSNRDLKNQAKRLVGFAVDDLYTNKQVENMARTLKVESISNGKIIYTVKDPYGTIQKLEQPYTVGKDGQIIPKNWMSLR